MSRVAKAKHTMLASLMLTLIAVITTVSITPHIVDQQQNHLEHRSYVAPLWPEAFYNSTLCVRNLGNSDVDIDAIYYVDTGKRAAVHVKLLNTTVRIPPKGLECIPIDPLPNTADVEERLMLVLAGENGPLAAYDVDVLRAFDIIVAPSPGAGQGGSGTTPPPSNPPTPAPAPPSPPSIPTTPPLRLFLLVNTTPVGLAGRTPSMLSVDWLAGGEGYGTAAFSMYYPFDANTGAPESVYYGFLVIDPVILAAKMLETTAAPGTQNNAVGDYSDACRGAAEATLFWTSPLVNAPVAPYNLVPTAMPTLDTMGTLPLIGTDLRIEQLLPTNLGKGGNQVLFLGSYGACSYDAAAGAYYVYGSGVVDDPTAADNTFTTTDFLIVYVPGVLQVPQIYGYTYVAGNLQLNFAEPGTPLSIASTSRYIVVAGSFLETVGKPQNTYVKGLFLIPKASPTLNLKLLSIQTAVDPVLRATTLGQDLVLVYTTGSGFGIARVTDKDLDTATQSLVPISLPAVEVVVDGCNILGGCHPIDAQTYGLDSVIAVAAAAPADSALYYDTPSTQSILVAIYNFTSNLVTGVVNVTLNINGTDVWLSNLKLLGVDNNRLWIGGYYGAAPFGLKGLFLLGLNMTLLEGGATVQDYKFTLGATSITVKMSLPKALPANSIITLADVSKTVIANVQATSYGGEKQVLTTPVTELPAGVVVLFDTG